MLLFLKSYDDLLIHGCSAHFSSNEDLFSSRMMSMHSSTHSSQMNTGRAGDELAHLVLALAAERAMERFLGFAAADLVHLRTSTRYKSSQP